MKKLLIASVLAFSSLPLTANAQPAPEWATLVTLDVPYGDLNLSNPMGAKVMLNRIKFAATTVCGSHTDLREVREHMVFKACVRDAMEGAIDELHAPLVTSLYRGELAGSRLAYEPPHR